MSAGPTLCSSRRGGARCVWPWVAALRGSTPRVVALSVPRAAGRADRDRARLSRSSAAVRVLRSRPRGGVAAQAERALPRSRISTLPASRGRSARGSSCSTSTRSCGARRGSWTGRRDAPRCGRCSTGRGRGAWCSGDRGRLGQALDNLIVNALEHGGGPVTVSGALTADTVPVAVLDRGRGADAAARATSSCARGVLAAAMAWRSPARVDDARRQPRSCEIRGGRGRGRAAARAETLSARIAGRAAVRPRAAARRRLRRPRMARRPAACAARARPPSVPVSRPRRSAVTRTMSAPRWARWYRWWWPRATCREGPAHARARRRAASRYVACRRALRRRGAALRRGCRRVPALTAARGRRLRRRRSSRPAAGADGRAAARTAPGRGRGRRGRHDRATRCARGACRRADHE